MNEAKYTLLYHLHEECCNLATVRCFKELKNAQQAMIKDYWETYGSRSKAKAPKPGDDGLPFPEETYHEDGFTTVNPLMIHVGDGEDEYIWQIQEIRTED